MNYELWSGSTCAVSKNTKKHFKILGFIFFALHFAIILSGCAKIELGFDILKGKNNSMKNEKRSSINKRKSSIALSQLVPSNRASTHSSNSLTVTAAAAAATSTQPATATQLSKEELINVLDVSNPNFSKKVGRFDPFYPVDPMEIDPIQGIQMFPDDYRLAGVVGFMGRKKYACIEFGKETHVVKVGDVLSNAVEVRKIDARCVILGSKNKDNKQGDKEVEICLKAKKISPEEAAKTQQASLQQGAQQLPNLNDIFLNYLKEKYPNQQSSSTTQGAQTTTSTTPTTPTTSTTPSGEAQPTGTSVQPADNFTQYLEQHPSQTTGQSP